MAAIESSVKKPAREPLAKLFTKLYSEQLLSCDEFAMGCARSNRCFQQWHYRCDVYIWFGFDRFAFRYSRRIAHSRAKLAL